MSMSDDRRKRSHDLTHLTEWHALTLMNAHIGWSVCAGSGRWWGYHQWDGVVMEPHSVACDCNSFFFFFLPCPIMRCTNPRGPHAICRPSYTQRGFLVWRNVRSKMCFHLSFASKLSYYLIIHLETTTFPFPRPAISCCIPIMENTIGVWKAVV